MRTAERPCEWCKTKVQFNVLDKVSDKEDFYHIQCDRGHDDQMYISSNLYESMKNNKK